MKLKLLLLFVVLFSLNNSNAQDIQLVNKIVGNGDPANYYIGHFAVPGSDGLDLHWYGGIRFGDQTSNSVMQITNGNVGIGTSTPRAKLDVASDISNGQLGTVFGRLPEGDTDGTGTFLGVKGYSTQGVPGDVKSFSIVHDFYGRTNNSINFYRGGNMLGGFMTFSTNDNTEKMRITENGNVGIGTTTPNSKLDVYIATPTIGRYDSQKWSTNSSNYNLKLQTIWNDGGINQEFVQRFNGTDYTSLAFYQGNVGIGTTTPDQKLTVNGIIHAEEIIVDLAVPADYVFQKYYTGKSNLKSDYVMPTLAEIENFTKKNHHLPNVPSAQEVQQNGVSLGEMSNVLLQKMEELTLYAIEQNKELERLKTENNMQSKEIKTLKKENEIFINLSKRLAEIENQLK